MRSSAKYWKKRKIQVMNVLVEAVEWWFDKSSKSSSKILNQVRTKFEPKLIQVRATNRTWNSSIRIRARTRMLKFS